MSSLPIVSIAAIARATPSASGRDITSSSCTGTTCHETPNLSTSQPHWLGRPPSAVRVSQ